MENRFAEEIAMLTYERDVARCEVREKRENAHAWEVAAFEAKLEVARLKLALIAANELACQRGIQRDALLRAAEPILFIDGNYSEDVVYRGTEAAMAYVSWEGGCPDRVTEAYARRPGVRVVDAPAHWQVPR